MAVSKALKSDNYVTSEERTGSESKELMLESLTVTLTLTLSRM